ncbi:lactate permease [Kibdelosporangium phytohabitans]|nr:L-lactate permease [Kibdelosporangium phytohabitans]MBE1468390.1 lactate permease [Kibdelosporangium phytohabitans]
MLAYQPYVVIIVIFAIGQIPAVTSVLAKATVVFHWPGLNVADSSGKLVSGNNFTLPLVNTGGTLVLPAGVVTAVARRVGARAAVAEWGRTVYELRFAILTVTGVLALAYVMNLSRQTTTIGYLVAGAGAALAFFSPVLGWFGVAVSGSDTSANCCSARCG